MSHRYQITLRTLGTTAEDVTFIDAVLLTVNEFTLDDWRRAEADRGRAW